MRLDTNVTVCSLTRVTDTFKVTHLSHVSLKSTALPVLCTPGAKALQEVFGVSKNWRLETGAVS